MRGKPMKKLTRSFCTEEREAIYWCGAIPEDRELMLKIPNSPMASKGGFLKARIRVRVSRWNGIQ